MKRLLIITLTLFILQTVHGDPLETVRDGYKKTLDQLNNATFLYTTSRGKSTDTEYQGFKKVILHCRDEENRFIFECLTRWDHSPPNDSHSVVKFDGEKSWNYFNQFRNCSVYNHDSGVKMLNEIDRFYYDVMGFPLLEILDNEITDRESTFFGIKITGSVSGKLVVLEVIAMDKFKYVYRILPDKEYLWDQVQLFQRIDGEWTYYLQFNVEEWGTYNVDGQIMPFMKKGRRTNFLHDENEITYEVLRIERNCALDELMQEFTLPVGTSVNDFTNKQPTPQQTEVQEKPSSGFGARVANISEAPTFTLAEKSLGLSSNVLYELLESIEWK